MNLEILRLAQHDVDHAAQYYGKQRTGLDDEFLAEVDAAVAIVVADPLLFGEIRAGVRCCLLNHFPYGVYYRMPEADTVQIVVVKHHRRRPGYGMRRK